MKKNLVSITFDTPGWIPSGPRGFEWLGIGSTYHFTGYVYGNIISPSKLFKNAFGFELPDHTIITYG